MSLTIQILLFSLTFPSSYTSRVLITPHPFVTSHVRDFYRLASQLVQKNYNVTVLRWPATIETKKMTPVSGANDIVYSLEKYDWVNDKFDSIFWKSTSEAYIEYVSFMANGGTDVSIKPCELLLENKELLERLKNANYSLGIMDPSAYPCSWTLMNYLKIPYICMYPGINVHFVNRGSATPTPVSYVASVVDGYSDRMNFIERTKNFFDHFLFSSSVYWTFIEALIRATTIWTNTDLEPVMTFYNANDFLEHPRPHTHGILNSGFKQRLKQSIRDEFECDDHLNGTIVFSLTTMGEKDRMSQKMKNIFLDTFLRFPDYQIIWRSRKVPSNGSFDRNGHIYYTNWINQTNVFAKTKTRLLITHGGGYSILEALRHGVPIIAMPLGLDHHGNIGRIPSKGLGLRLQKQELSVQRLTQMIRKILTDNSYKARTTALASMTDTDQDCRLDNPGLWWTEYSIRHGTILNRFKAKGESLSYFSYFFVDLIVVMLIYLCIHTSL